MTSTSIITNNVIINQVHHQDQNQDQGQDHSSMMATTSINNNIQHIKQLDARFSSFLFILRYMSSFLLLLLAILPTNQFLLRTGSLHVPFLLFLSSFTLTLIHYNSNIRATTFYINRFTIILPLFIISLILHANHSLEYIAPNLIPTLCLAYTIFPVILQLLPTSLNDNFYVTLLMLGSYILTAGQAYWLISVPIANVFHPNSLIHFSFIDIILYIPFITNLPPFLFGISIALFVLSSSSSSSSASSSVTSASLRIRLVLKFIVSVISFILSLMFIRAYPLSYYSDSKFSVSALRIFFSVWYSTGFLLPLYAFVIISGFHLFQNMNPSSNSTATTPLISSSTSTNNRPYLFLKHLPSFSLTYYFFVPSLYHLLSSVLCPIPLDSFFDFRTSKTSTSYCLKPIIQSTSTLSSTLSSFPPTSITSFSGSGLSPFVFIPISTVIILFAYIIIINPMISYIRKQIFKILPSYNNEENIEFSPNRSYHPVILYIRLIIFYISCISSISLIFNFTLPFKYLPNQHDNILCKLFLNCHNFNLDIWDIGIGKIVKQFILMSRWIIIVILPSMLSNILGQLLYPRPYWKKIPSISNMFKFWNMENKQRKKNKSACSEDEDEDDWNKKQICNNDTNNTNNNSISSSSLTSTGSLYSSSSCGGGTNIDDSNVDSIINNNNEHGRSRRRSSESASVIKEGMNMEFKMYFRYVTRGMNRKLVKSNVHRAISILKSSGIPEHMWMIEVVTDEALYLNDIKSNMITSKIYNEIVVPCTYEAPNGAKFKARALHYAIYESNAKENDWIIHLDEETTFDLDTIESIIYHCSTEDYKTNVIKQQSYSSIGQGLILYNRNIGNNMLTLADCGRVSDDCGRFRLQYENNSIWIGMHGSFIIISNRIEQLITFDHGLCGSIAEDAFFALLTKSKLKEEVGFKWIDSIMYEQSTFTAIDFIKQRSRWAVGGLLVCSSKKIPFHVKWTLCLLIFGWCCMPVVYPLIMLSGLVLPYEEKSKWNLFDVIVALITALSVWNYAFGFFVSFSIKGLGMIRFCTFLFVTICCIPAFGILESMAVCHALYSFLGNCWDFHVVQKERNDDIDEETQTTCYGTV